MLYIGYGSSVLHCQDITVRGEETARVKKVISPAEYRSLLDEWIRFFESEPPEICCGHPDGINDEITVKDGNSEFIVSTVFVREKPDNDYDDENDDQKADPAKKEEEKRKWSVQRHDQVLTYLRLLRDNLDSSAKTPDPSNAAKAEEGAKAVLASREFRLVKTPGTTKTWQERFTEWVQDWLRRVWPKMPSVHIVSQTLLWLIFGVVIVGAGVLVKRWLEREEREEFRWRLGSAAGQISSKHWTAWIEEARQAGRLGDWRQAVRLGYWAAISSLESSGAWKPDRARTPREYLKLLAASHQHLSALTSMTKDFERVWYAQLPATEEDYKQIVQGLERIGCR